MMRVTKVDGCCAPDYGAGQHGRHRRVRVGRLDGEHQRAPRRSSSPTPTGKTCVRDPGAAEFQGYGVEITFCEVSPCLFSHRHRPALRRRRRRRHRRVPHELAVSASPTPVSPSKCGWASPAWPARANAGAYGYLLLPCLQGGVIGDFTIENAAITFTVTGATTKDGNGWGIGPVRRRRRRPPAEPAERCPTRSTPTTTSTPSSPPSPHRPSPTAASTWLARAADGAGDDSDPGRWRRRHMDPGLVAATGQLRRPSATSRRSPLHGVDVGYARRVGRRHPRPLERHGVGQRATLPDLR